MKKAVMLGRFQPIHKGHIEAIIKTKLKYDHIHVFVGKAHKVSERNPFDAEHMMKLLLEKTGLEASEVSILPDTTDETDNSNAWAEYLTENVKRVTKGYEPVFICGVKDIDKSADWFEGTGIKLDPIKTSVDVSATEVREVYFKYKERLAIMDNLKTSNKRIWILGATGVGKSTFIRKLNLDGLPSTTEFDPASHEFVTSLTTNDYNNEATQTLIAGMKFSHVMSSNAIIHERTMVDNLAFFDNEKFKEATDYNKRLQQIINDKFDNMFIYLNVDWETNKKQIIGRGRPNEQTEEALAYYEDLNKNYRARVIEPLNAMLPKGKKVFEIEGDKDNVEDIRLILAESVGV